MSTKPLNDSVSRKHSLYNVVKFDGRLKEVFHQEKLTRKQWETKWGFSRNMMKMYNDAIAAKGIKLKRKDSRIWSISTPIMEIPLSPPVPNTSSGFVGWRSSLPECSLERAGPLYISPKLTIEPPEDRSKPPQLGIHVV